MTNLHTLHQPYADTLLPAVPAASTRHPAPGGRTVFIKWLRKTHSWIGLWGAALGLLFGLTGILLNHRDLLKIPIGRPMESTLQLALPTPAPKDPQAMALWLQRELGFDRPAVKVRGEKSRLVAWGARDIIQPARWSAVLSSPGLSFQSEYWVGNSFVTVRRNESNVLTTLNNLHKGNGVGIGWILLVDTLAGSIIVLSLTGVLLWLLTTRRRLIGTCIGLISVTTGVTLALLAL